MTTVQHPSQPMDGWKDQPVIEDPLENSLLMVKALRLLLVRPVSSYQK
jgi:hypothetical protein